MTTERRLIDANALLPEIVKAQALEPAKAVAKIILLVTEAESVDAVEVVHGRWIEKPNPWGQDGSHSYDCSICGERTCVVGHKLRYRPNCGAKMDGERKTTP